MGLMLLVRADGVAHGAVSAGRRVVGHCLSPEQAVADS